jgi:thioredoxin reductase
MASVTDIAIIGAGPYGLSVGAHLNKAGIELALFGAPMQTWIDHMPSGMQMRSDPVCSSLADPDGELPLATYCRNSGIPYDDHHLPIRRDDFIGYGLEFQRRFVPQVQSRRVVNLERASGGYRLQFDDGEDVVAGRVVVATGYLPFRYVPAALRQLPVELASHSSDYGSLERLRDKDVVVVGAGASAIDLAALLARQGTRVTLIARAPHLQMKQARAAASGRASLMHPRRSSVPPAATRNVGERWLMRLCTEAPQLIHHLPDTLRVALLDGTPSPAGGGLADVPMGDNIAIKLSRPVIRAHELGGRLQLTVVGSDGSREQLDCDHVIAATGYRVDLRKLEFLREGLLSELRMLDHSPLLTADFESSAPGLYFAGLPAARTFGPALRSIQGAVHPARRILEQLADVRTERSRRTAA